MSFYGVNPPDAVKLLDRYGVNLPADQKDVKDAISCVLVYLELLRSGNFCRVCEGRGYRTVQKPYPPENGYSPMMTCTATEVCYGCSGDCLSRKR